ncbi:replication protein [Serratia ureilytica]|uniref:replication protein n=1 Tax=Serratia ureilytica TaxID=300181 RepID=UPI003FA69E00
MGVVKQLSNYRPQLEVVEQRVADTDDGYTRIANELLEAVMSADLTARQLKVALAIIRKTYGFGKKVDRITNTQIASMTGIHHTHVCTAKNEMIAMNIIITSGFQIGINKVVSDWKLSISQDSKTLAKSANKSLAKSANEHSPTQLNTKETIQKKERKDKNTMPEQVQAEYEKTPSEPAKPNPVDEAFESTFWCAGMVKTGKKAAKSAFATQFREWRKQSGGSPIQFAQFLADDIACRKGKQFGFEKLHPATYLNGKRWEDEKPSSPAATQTTAAVFYGQNSFHADFSKL